MAGEGRELRALRSNGDGARLDVWEKIQRVGALPGDYRSRDIAQYELAFDPDMGEVQLRKYTPDQEPEIIYSEFIGEAS